MRRARFPLDQESHLLTRSACLLLRTSMLSLLLVLLIDNTGNRLHMFQCLGFTVVDPESTSPTCLSAKATIAPPALKTNCARLRLLRAWVEIGAWLQDYRKRFRAFVLGAGVGLFLMTRSP